MTVETTEKPLLPGEEDPTDFLLDADGNELRKGDHVLILGGRTEWAGRIVEVERARRTCNTLGIRYRRTTTGCRPLDVRRVDTSGEAGQRLLLRDLFDHRSELDAQAAVLEGQRAAVTIKISRLRKDLGDV